MTDNLIVTEFKRLLYANTACSNILHILLHAVFWVPGDPTGHVTDQLNQFDSVVLCLRRSLFAFFGFKILLIFKLFVIFRQ